VSVTDNELMRRSLSDALIGRVLNLIHREGLGPGDRLPAARALAERFAVATPTMREASRRRPSIDVDRAGGAL
jgi:GntR family transcriptional repressor for pyruvate dehydrogenase complex